MRRAANQTDNGLALLVVLELKAKETGAIPFEPKNTCKIHAMFGQVLDTLVFVPLVH